MRTSRFVVRKRRGVAQAIMTWLLTIIIIAAVYIPLNFAVQMYQNIQVQLWPTGIFDPNTLVFVNSYWLFFPVIVFFTGIGYVYLRAQRQGPE